MRRLALFTVVALAPSLAFAEPRPAPDYFVATVMDAATARQLAAACPAIDVNPMTMGGMLDELDFNLKRDGFDQENLAEDMLDPSEQLTAYQQAFLDRHNLANGATEEQACAAARAEMDAETVLGTLMVELGN